MLSQEEIERIVQMKGLARGAVFRTDFEYVQSKEGKSGVEKLEQAMEKLGCKIAYENIQNTEWLPVGLRIVSVLVAKDLFSWEDKEIFTMGYIAPKNSFLVKI